MKRMLKDLTTQSVKMFKNSLVGIVTKAVLFLTLLSCPAAVVAQADGCSELENTFKENEGKPVMGQQAKEMLRNCYLDEIEIALGNNMCDVAQAYYEKLQAVLGENGDAQAKQRIWECMNCIGYVTTGNGKKIFLMQQERDGVHVVTAYSMQGNQLEETDVFNITGKLRSSIYSVQYDCWSTSHPKGGFFIFNPTDNLLYIPLIGTVSWGQVCGSDRYIVYKFNGEQFVLHNRNEGGFWMHPSLRKFKSFVAILRTPNYLIRIDETADKFRYAAWKSDAEMTDIPDLVLVDDHIEPQVFGFSNGAYEYVIDMNNHILSVMKNVEVLREEQFEVIICWDVNCWSM